MRAVVSKPPFQVTEHGWGEFEIQITINFVDPTEDAVHFIHPLHLYERRTIVFSLCLCVYIHVFVCAREQMKDMCMFHRSR